MNTLSLRGIHSEFRAELTDSDLETIRHALALAAGECRKLTKQFGKSVV